MQRLLLIDTKRRVESCGQFSRVGRAGLRQHVPASIREGDTAGATVLGVKFAANESRCINAINEFAGCPYGDAQRPRKIADAQGLVSSDNLLCKLRSLGVGKHLE